MRAQPSAARSARGRVARLRSARRARRSAQVRLRVALLHRPVAYPQPAGHLAVSRADG